MVKGAPYPAIVREEGAATEGTLYRGFDAPRIALIDEYEGSLYDRVRSEVLTKKGELVNAIIYIVPDSRKHFVSNQLWNKEEFERLYLKSFCKSL
jgi:gamma-glutamylcyclotransferase (GGCT)/AIG2-like uncharacterized protein YtfP